MCNKIVQTQVHWIGDVLPLAPPELVAFDFTPKTIDVSSGPQTVTATLRVTDNLSGVRGVNVTFARPSGPETFEPGSYRRYRQRTREARCLEKTVKLGISLHWRDRQGTQKP